jgi:curved DNA-binding protein CbpA
MLQGERPEAPKTKAAPRAPAEERPRSAWEILGVEQGADRLAIKRAYRERALATHPDQGGDAALFREVQRAYERLSRARRPR